MKTLRAMILLVLLGAVSPLLLQAQTTESYTFTTNRVVPDGNAAGLAEVRNVNSAIGNITALKVRLKLTGEFNGDLHAYVRHSSGFTVLLNRPGKTAGNTAGYADSGFDVTFQTGAANGDIHAYQTVTTPAAGLPLTGLWQPDGRTADPTNVTEVSARSSSLTNFNGLNAAGEWTLYLADVESGGTNMLTEWSLEITGAAYPTLTWANPADITYGTALSGTQLNATATYNATNVPGTFTYTPTNGTVLNAGLGQTLSVNFTPTDTTSFLSIGTNVTINVQQATLTITANSTNKTYGQTLTFAGTEFITAGLTNGDTVASVTLASSGAAAAATIGTYAIAPTNAVGSGLTNYTLSYVDGTLTIDPAALTITANSTNKTYGQTLTFAGTEFTTAGLTNSDTVTSVALTSSGAAAAATTGNYAIAPTNAVGSGLTNYTLSYVDGTLTVDARLLTITANSTNKTYGQTLTFAGTEFITAGLTNGDTVASVTLASSGAAAAATIGTYAIAPTNAVGSGLTNYTLSYVDGTLTVDVRSLTITANSTNKTYGQTRTFAGTEFSTIGLTNSDSVSSVTLASSGAAAAATIGTYAIAPTNAVGSGLTNYALSYVDGTLTIDPAALTITANSTNKTYGQTLTFVGTEFTTAGLTNSDTVTSVTLTSSGAAAAATIGTYAIAPTNAVGSGLTNYAFNYVDGTLTVDVRSLTITANSTNKTYGQTLTFAGTEFSTAGLTNSDTVTSVSLASSGAAAAATTGTYAIAPTNAAGSGLTNYTLSYVDGTLTIGTATLTITADDKSKAFGATLPTLTATYTGFVNGEGTNSLTALATLATTATATSNAGTYPITASGAASTNYAFNYVDGTLTITQSLTSGALLSSANPALPGSNVTFTMTVSAVAPGAGTPSGTVNFRIDGSILGSGALSGGVAAFTTNNLAHGSHTVVAEYAGNANFIGSTNSLTPDQVINTPPIAGGDTLERYPTQGVKVRLATLLANDSDADADTLNIAVNSTNVNGATITVSGGWVFYTPAPGFTNADSFTYTITDGQGGSATNTVTVALKVDEEPGQNLTITDLGGGSFLIRGNGISGRTYRLEYSDTSSPFTWLVLAGGSVTADGAGVFQFTDTSGSGSRYYRSVYP